MDEDGKSQFLVKKKFVKMILELKENHHMNESGTSLISSTLMEILEWFLEELEAKLVQESSDIHAEAFSLVKQQGRKLIMNSPLLEVNTEHKIKKYLLDKCGLVKPQEIVLGSEYNVEVQSDSETISEAEEKAMIVPMVEQLTQLFTNREIYNYTFTAPVNQSSDNVIRNAKDGSVYKNHRICQLYPDALLIQLYIDDVEMVNPLGSHTKKNKITVFYWNLLNLPNHMRSSLKAINLYGFALSTSIKKFGYQEMLRNFLQTIQQLETPDGLLIRLGNEPVILHGTLISVSGDGLALNEIGGFKSIGSLTFKFCRNCDLDRNEIFKSFVERNIRAFPQHKERVKKIQAEPTKIVRDEMCKTYGINGESIFSTLQNFDITKGLPQDLMHNLLEGVQEVEIRALLFRLIEDFKVLTYQNLNHLLKSFPYPESLKSSKPSPIDRAHVVSGKLRQSASQMISLLCVMPFLLEPYHDDQTASFIDNFILLAKISNILLSFEVDRPTLDLSRYMIEKHHSRYQTLYPEFPMTPKFHLMIHAPSVIEQFGPVRETWTMRFEGLNAIVSKIGEETRNFQHVTKTLANRFQSKKCLDLDFGNPNFRSLGDKTFCPAVTHKVELKTQLMGVEISRQLKNATEVSQTNKIFIQNNDLREDSILLVQDGTDTLPVFGRVRNIFVSNDECAFLMQAFETICFNYLTNSYEVLETDKFAVINQTKLPYLHPLPCIKMRGKTSVMLQYY